MAGFRGQTKRLMRSFAGGQVLGTTPSRAQYTKFNGIIRAVYLRLCNSNQPDNVMGARGGWSFLLGFPPPFKIAVTPTTG